MIWFSFRGRKPRGEVLRTPGIARPYPRGSEYLTSGLPSLYFLLPPGNPGSGGPSGRVPSSDGSTGSVTDGSCGPISLLVPAGITGSSFGNTLDPLSFLSTGFGAGGMNGLLSFGCTRGGSGISGRIGFTPSFPIDPGGAGRLNGGTMSFSDFFSTGSGVNSGLPAGGAGSFGK